MDKMPNRRGQNTELEGMRFLTGNDNRRGRRHTQEIRMGEGMGAEIGKGKDINIYRISK